jgi:hypothetical protein
MPGNLTFKDLVFTNSLCLRNCSIDGLNILNCHFYDNGTNAGANIDISPTSLVDKYGRDVIDEETASTVWHWSSVIPHVSNITIDNNVIDNASKVDDYTIPNSKGKNPDSTTAIYVSSVNNLEITNNLIMDTAFNGIQVAGKQGSYSTGRIGILNNTVYHSGSRGIRVSALKNAELFMHSNSLRDDNRAPEELDNEEHVKVSGCTDTEYTWLLSTKNGGQGYNTYRIDMEHEQTHLSVGDGITLESDKSTKWTDDKKDEIIADVIAALPVYNGEVV